MYVQYVPHISNCVYLFWGLLYLDLLRGSPQNKNSPSIDLRNGGLSIGKIQKIAIKQTLEYIDALN